MTVCHSSTKEFSNEIQLVEDPQRYIITNNLLASVSCEVRVYPQTEGLIDLK